MKQILLTNGLPKETVTAIMILDRNRKVKICSVDGETNLTIFYILFLIIYFILMLPCNLKVTNEIICYS